MAVRALCRLMLVVTMMSGSSHGLKASTKTATVEKAQGDAAVLDCTWDTDPVPTGGALDIEWFRPNVDSNSYVASYSGSKAFVFGDYLPRVAFAGNVSQRDASIRIGNLQAKDDGTYTCKVKIAPDISQVAVTLHVLVKPSAPSCVVNGPVQLGKDLLLQCQSAEGTSPIAYEWRKTSGDAQPARAAVGGSLSIKNASVSDSGMYQCNATNRIGWQSCVVLLSVAPPTSNAGVVAGAVIGVLLVVAVIGFLVWFLLRRRQGKPAGDYHNDIRMDDSPPASVSRPPTRAAHDLPSARTSIGSATPSNGLLPLRSGAPSAGGRGGPAGPGGPPYDRVEGRAAFPSVREESELSSGGHGGGGGHAYDSVPRDDGDYDSESGDDLPPSHSPEPPKPKVAGGSAALLGGGEGNGGGGGGASPSHHRLNLARMGAVAVMVPAQTRSSVNFA